MGGDHDIKLDLAHARQRELIAAGERARLARRPRERRGRRADAARTATGRLRGWAGRRGALLDFLLRRARLSAVREHGPC
jgi:hypothetical protein